MYHLYIAERVRLKRWQYAVESRKESHVAVVVVNHVSASIPYQAFFLGLGNLEVVMTEGVVCYKLECRLGSRRRQEMASTGVNGRVLATMRK